VEAEAIDIVKIKERVRENLSDIVAKETALTIFLNSRECVTLFCTCDKPEYLAVGFLDSEGLLRNKEDIESIRVDSNRTTVRVNTKSKLAPVEGRPLKRFTSGSGKGAAWYYTRESTEPTAYERISSHIRISAEKVLELMQTFQRSSELFTTTGGVHGAALCDMERLILYNEDVGRHNAIDKTFGEALLNDVSTNDKILLTSGRVSSEMLTKAAKKGVPIVVSISAPTDLAVSLARSLGMTLIGFARGKGMNIYSGDWRII
jgi:FdhD protein